ncbi:MAG: hypothetical protein Q7V01_01090 [Vicinamibacterales bacterium]|nr:hypothetical protein [Vicinamibacterales bacterium]
MRTTRRNDRHSDQGMVAIAQERTSVPRKGKDSVGDPCVEPSREEIAQLAYELSIGCEPRGNLMHRSPSL